MNDIELRLKCDVYFRKLVSFLTSCEGSDIKTSEVPQTIAGDHFLLRQYFRILIKAGCLQLSDADNGRNLSRYRVTSRIGSLAAELNAQ